MVTSYSRWRSMLKHLHYIHRCVSNLVIDIYELHLNIKMALFQVKLTSFVFNAGHSTCKMNIFCNCSKQLATCHTYFLEESKSTYRYIIDIYFWRLLHIPCSIIYLFMNVLWFNLWLFKWTDLQNVKWHIYLRIFISSLVSKSC
jgi:hypothetical protein